MGLVCVCEEELAVGNKAVTVGWVFFVLFCFFAFGIYIFFLHSQIQC